MTPKVCPDCFAPVSKKGNRCNTCGGRNRWATGKGSKRTSPITASQNDWNRRRKPLPAIADGTGCAHHWLIPTQPEPPLGRCTKCGRKRMHSNVLPGEMEFRLPPGYHLAGVAD